MIKDYSVAKELSEILLKCGSELDRSVAIVKESCSEEELVMYRNSAGKVMGELLIEMMNPIYKLHPDIKPKRLK